MPEKIKQIADSAEVIISGFAISKSLEGIRVYDLNNGYGAAVFLPDGTLVETNMDDIELSIAKDCLTRGYKYMEA